MDILIIHLNARKMKSFNENNLKKIAKINNNVYLDFCMWNNICFL